MIFTARSMEKDKIVIAGDLFPTKNNHEKFSEGDAEWLFGSEIYEIIKRANYSIANLEGAFTTRDTPISKIGPAIGYYPETINAIKELGIKLLLTANNHSTDYGRSGYEDTISVIKKSGIDYIGSGYLGNIEKFRIIHINSKVVCIYNVAEEMFNVPDNDVPGAHLYDEYVVCKDIKDLKNQCDFVFVLYHGGTEYFPYPSPELKKKFHRMADNGADIVVAQHTHCIGCEEFYNNSYLLYGQGNFLFDRQKTPITHQGLLLELSVCNTLIIKRHYYHVDGGHLIYDKEPDLTNFRERNINVLDDNYIKTVFSRFSLTQFNELTKEWRKYSKIELLIRKLLPSALFKRLFGLHVNKAKLETIHYVLKSEQKRETALYMIKELLNSNNNIYIK